MACPSAATAVTNRVFQFDTAPSGDLRTYENAIWRSARGNPASGGYLSLHDATNSQSGIVVFPDVDDGQVVRGFRIRADLRLGNPVGNEGRPAEGLSLSFARDSDPIVLRADNGETPDGYEDSAGAHEMGTRTGLAISLDAWSGNSLPDGPDIEGILVRLDNVTLARVALTVRNGSCNDTNSLQTGPYTADLNGAVDRLCWQPLEVELDPSAQLTVKWKGTTVLDRQPTAFVPSRCRLVLMGRTGLANQNSHIDNIQISTTPVDSAFVSGLTPRMNGFELRIEDAPGSIVDPDSITAQLDGVAVPVAISRRGGTTTVLYTVPNGGRLASASDHVSEVTFRDLSGNTFRDSQTWSAPSYGAFVAFSKVADANTLERGFRIRPHQVDFGQPNDLAWTEQQLAGSKGTNRVNLALAGLHADAEGFIAWDNKPIDFRNATGGQGFFGLDFGYDQLGLPGFNEDGSRIANEDNAALEILGFIEFPTAGGFTMNVSSDDGFRLQTGPDPRDLLAERLGEFNSGREVDAGTTFDVWVEEPGIYPFRLIWENGSGGAGLEWSHVAPDGTRHLVGNPGDPLSLKTYRNRTNQPPYTVSIYPPPGGTQVHAQPNLTVVFENGSQVDASTVRLSLDGQPLPVTPSAIESRLVATARSPGLLASDSLHTASLSYTTRAPTTVTQAWTFRILPYADVLPVATAGDLSTATNGGFRVRTWQIQPAPDQVDPELRVPGHLSYAEAMLSGIAGTNAANTARFVDDGFFTEIGTINYAPPGPSGLPEPAGAFPSETLVPGIPGTGSAPEDSFATEVLTYVAFPNPGFYMLGVNSDDGFQVSPQHAAGALPLTVLAPTSVAGSMAAVPSVRGNNQGGGVFGPLPQIPIEAGVVPVVGNHATALPREGCGTALVNSNALRGNIALVMRGTCNFLEKVRNAAQAGAIAVIVYNNRSDPPIVMGGDPNDLSIPALMINRSDGTRLAAATQVRARIQSDDSPKLAMVNGERTAADTLFGFRVEQPGAYPLRLLWQQTQGAASMEWFSIDADGVKSLINDPTNPRSLKSFLKATVIPKPTVRIERFGVGAILHYEGVLQAAEEAGGPYTDYPGAPINGPFTIPERDSAQFYRARSAP